MGSEPLWDLEEEEGDWFKPPGIRGDNSISRTISSTPFLTPMMINGALHHVPSPSPSVTPFLSGLSQRSSFAITPNKSVCFTPIKAPVGFDDTPKASKPVPFHSPEEVPRHQAKRPHESKPAATRKGTRTARAVLFPAEGTPLESISSPKGTRMGPEVPKGPKKGDQGLSNITERAHRRPAPVQAVSISFQDTSVANREQVQIQTEWTPIASRSTAQMNDPFELSTPSGLVVVSNSALVEGGRLLLSLLGVIGVAYQHLCQFRVREALETFKTLSDDQYRTGWVLTQVGRAHLELTDYLTVSPKNLFTSNSFLNISSGKRGF